LFTLNDELYLEVHIGSETLAPPQPVTCTAFSMKAAVAETVLDGAITTIMIEDGAVDSQKLGNDSVTGTKIADGTVSYVDIQDGSTLEEIKDDDGSGSGLDADRLDGLEASAFMASSADNWVNETGDTMTGPLTVTKPYFGTGFQHSIKGSLIGGNAVGAGVYGYSESPDAYGVYGGATAEGGVGVYGEATYTEENGNYGGYFTAAGSYGIGVYGEATAENGVPFGNPNYGGLFIAAGVAGTGVRGEATGGYGHGVVGITEGLTAYPWGSAIGVRGQATNTGNTGFTDHPNRGGYFTAADAYGRGVEGRATNTGAYGNYGGYFVADGYFGRGVYGKATDMDHTNHGGFFESAGLTGRGVYGGASGAEGRGVYGQATSTGASDANYGGYFVAQGGNGAGVYGKATATSGYNWGVAGRSDSTDGMGVSGYASATSGSRQGVRGEVNGSGYGLYTLDNLYVGGTCTGCTSAFIAQNASQEPLKVGDVVAVSGIGPILKGHKQPILEVRHATASDPSVLGVAQSRGEFYAASEEQEENDDSVQPVEGDAEPGDYLFVVTSGLAQVRLASSLQRITPGESLSAGRVSGLAKPAESGTRPEVVFARAMEAEPDENGLIWALVNTR
jgi:hypothetical protein